jgi:hypothetical protein
MIYGQAVPSSVVAKKAVLEVNCQFAALVRRLKEDHPPAANGCRKR